MDFPKPVWLTGQGGRSEELRFKVRLAAVYATPEGTVVAMTRKIGITEQALNRSINRGDFTPGMAYMIEDAAGREIVKREDLCSKLNSL